MKPSSVSPKMESILIKLLVDYKKLSTDENLKRFPLKDTCFNSFIFLLIFNFFDHTQKHIQ